MKNILKWILGIILALIVVAGLAGLIFVAHKKVSMNIVYERPRPNHPAWETPRNGPMEDQSFGERKPMGDRKDRFMPFHRPFPFHHRGFGHHFYGPGFLMLGGLMQLIPLAVLALLLVGAYQLGKRENVVAAANLTPVPAHPCPKCGNNVQDDWKYCPSCGKKQ
jgi:hypothetical protein